MPGCQVGGRLAGKSRWFSALRLRCRSSFSDFLSTCRCLSLCPLSLFQYSHVSPFFPLFSSPLLFLLLFIPLLSPLPHRKTKFFFSLLFFSLLSFFLFSAISRRSRLSLLQGRWLPGESRVWNETNQSTILSLPPATPSSSDLGQVTITPYLPTKKVKGGSHWILFVLGTSWRPGQFICRSALLTCSSYTLSVLTD